MRLGNFQITSKHIPAAILGLVVLLMFVILFSRGNVDDRGTQTVMLYVVPDFVERIDYVLVDSSVPADQVTDAYSLSDPMELYSQAGPAFSDAFQKPVEDFLIEIDQHWSYKQMTMAKRRFGYVQTYGYVVISVQMSEGDSVLRSIELPRYGKDVTVDLTD